MQTSEIEGEYLDRASVQSSVRRAFGLSADRRRGVAESGIADLLTHGFSTWQASLDDATVHLWHTMVCIGRSDLQSLGEWRQGPEPMQVVSGPMHRLGFTSKRHGQTRRPPQWNALSGGLTSPLRAANIPWRPWHVPV